MNKGAKLSKGKWLLFLGADDVLLEESVENCINNGEGYDIIYGDTLLKYPWGEIKRQFSRNYSEITKRSFACHQSIFVKKEVFENLGGFDEKYRVIADYDFFLRAYLQGVKVNKINSCVSLFNLSGLSSNNLSAARERYLIRKINNIPGFIGVDFLYEILIKILIKKVWWLKGKMHMIWV